MEFREGAFDFQTSQQNHIAYASVHLDESTPHMHMGVIPLKDGKLSSKTMFTKAELVKIQTELPDYLASKGFNVVRGQEKSQAKHLSVKEYKEMGNHLFFRRNYDNQAGIERPKAYQLFNREHGS